MTKPELGTKRTCPETGKNFYDLNKDPIVSPYTQEEYPLSFFEETADDAASLRQKAKTPETDPSEGEVDDEDAVAAKTSDDEDEGEEETVAELGDEDEATIPVGGMDDDEDDSGKSVPAGFTEQGVDDDDILDDDEDDFDIDVDADLDVEDDLPLDDEETK